MCAVFTWPNLCERKFLRSVVVVVGGSVRELESSLKKSNLHKMQTKPDKIAGGTTPRVEVLWQSGTTCDVAGSPDGLNR